MSVAQVAELRAIEPWSQEFGFRAFARKHGLKVNHVSYVRRKLGMPVVWLPRWNKPTATCSNSMVVTSDLGAYLLTEHGRAAVKK